MRIGGFYKLYEADEPVDINKKLVGTVKDSDTVTKKKIANLVSDDSVKDSILTSLEKTCNFSKAAATYLYKLIMDGDNDLTKFSEYLKDRTIDASQHMGEIKNFKIFNETTGINDPDTLKELMDVSFKKSPSEGPGENYMSIIFKDANRPRKHGDLEIGGQAVELKGVGARLQGQKGYGDAKEMRTALSKACVKVAEKVGIKNYEVEDTGDVNYWNIGPNNKGGGLAINFKKIAAAKPKEFGKTAMLNDACAEISNAWATVFKDVATKVPGYTAYFDGVVGKDGSIDTKKYDRALLCLSYTYYLSIENFNYFCAVHNGASKQPARAGNFLLIPSDVETFMKYYDKGDIIVKTRPSFTNDAGSQGGAIAISI